MGSRPNQASRYAFVLAIVVSAGIVAGCGDTNESASKGAEAPLTTATTTSAQTCRRANADLIASLEASLTARGELKAVRYVKIVDGPDAPLSGFKDGAFIVSAQLDAAGIEGTTMSWGVSKSMVDTGGGLALGLDSVTREFSDAGTAANEGSPARDYTDALKNTSAYDESRECTESG